MSFPQPHVRGNDEDKAQWAQFLNTTALTKQNIESARTASSGTRENRSTKDLSKSPVRQIDFVGNADATMQSSSENSQSEEDLRAQVVAGSKNSDPKYDYAPDLELALDLSNEEEVDPESLLQGHLNQTPKCSMKRENSTSLRMLGMPTFASYITLQLYTRVPIPLYDIHNSAIIYQSSDPFDTIAQKFVVEQKLMIDGQRRHYRSCMTQLKIDLKQMSVDHLERTSKSMRDPCDAKDRELGKIKADLRHLNIEHTLLASKHALLSIKSSQNGSEGHAQLQKDFKDLQSKLKSKEEESALYEQQFIFLTAAFQQQGMSLPSQIPMDAPAPAPAPPPAEDMNSPPGWDFGSAARARNGPGWGNVRNSAVVNHDNGMGSASSPASTMGGSRTGPSDSDNARPHAYDQIVTKGQEKVPLGKVKDPTTPMHMEREAEIRVMIDVIGDVRQKT
jgi:hypothetical protein